MIKINNRRYIGNKTKLLDSILDSVPAYINPRESIFADLFAGTGTVASCFAEQGYNIIVNDILYSNFVAYKAWLSNLPYDNNVVEELLNYYNSIKYSSLSDNYFSEIYAGKYFSNNDAKKIGFIRDSIENNRNEISEREYYILLASLLYSADKIANTVGHYEYYLKTPPKDTNFKMESLEIKNNNHSTLYNADANELAKIIKCDVAYIDPPYNSRQYVNFYHVLENLARWNKPTKFEGNSMKFERNSLKSGYSKSIAPILFKDLIDSLDCRVIIVSYSNTYNAKSIASINKIAEDQIMDILSHKGTVNKKAVNYSCFNAGKTDILDHQEYIFTCEVNR